jgi:hypothetical protein
MPFYAFICTFSFCLFCLLARIIFQLSGSSHHYRWQGCKFKPCLELMAFSSEGSFTCHAYWDTVRRTGTRVLQWGSNLRSLDPCAVALTTALWGRRCTFSFPDVCVIFILINFPTPVRPMSTLNLSSSGSWMLPKCPLRGAGQARVIWRVKCCRCVFSRALTSTG